MNGVTATPAGHEAADRLTVNGNEGEAMSMGDKIKNAAEDLVGKGKEATGNATDNESLRAEGQGDQASASTKQAGENVKDAAKKVFGS